MIAVVGTGSIGRRHIRNLLDLGHDVLAVSEHRKAASLDVDGREVPCTPSLAAALDRSPAAVVVGNPTSLHLATASEAVAAGADVYLEKPAALTGDDAAELAQRAADAGVVVAVGQQLRFHPLIAEAHRIVRSGELGTILGVDANLGEHLADYHPDEDYRTSYAARSELGGGVLLTQIHQLDVLVWMFGPFRSVAALGGHRSDLEIDVEDSVSFLAAAADGTPVHGHLDYLQRPKRWTLDVTGTAGRLALDLHAGSLAVTAPDGSVEVVDDGTERNALFVATMADFLAAAADRSAPRCTLHDATEALRLVDGIKASMGTGATVPLDPTPEAHDG